MRYVRPSTSPSRPRMALMRCSVPGTPARSSRGPHSLGQMLSRQRILAGVLWGSLHLA